jgi:hypothetical protein
MIEAEWLACNDPQAMLEFLRDKASDRKMRLFAVACLFRVRHLMPDRECWDAVLLVEDVAEGRVGMERLRDVEDAGMVYYDHRLDVPEERLGCLIGGAIFQLGQDSLDWACVMVARAVSDAVGWSNPDADGRAEPIAQCQSLRCIFGNPFRPVAFDPAWRSEAAVALASAVYAERAFDRLPILADALEEAGCDHPDILAHCRGPGPHARGCWVVDLVLGKS